MCCRCCAFGSVPQVPRCSTVTARAGTGTQVHDPSQLQAGMYLEHKTAVSASLDSPKHPKIPPKHLHDNLHLCWLLKHRWKMFRRAQGLAQSGANVFTSHRTEPAAQSLYLGMPWDPEEMHRTCPVSCRAQPCTGTPRAARQGLGTQGQRRSQQITSILS